MSSEIYYLSAVQLEEAYRGHELSPVEVTSACLEQIEEYEPVLNAFMLVDQESALENARRSEARWMKREPLGPLDGIPISVKDLLAKGWPSLRGSRIIDPNQPWDEDSPAVARVREQGGVILGKTNTAEFGWKGTTDSLVHGITRNPWNPKLTPGGSSGGAAAALSTGMCTLAITTDGGGSTRNPAGFTNLCGFKATFGRVPAYPPNPIGTLANTCAMARTVSDVASLFTVITRPDARDWLSLPYENRNYVEGLEDGVQHLRIAYSPNLGYGKVDPEISTMVNSAALAFESLGAKVEEVRKVFDDPTWIFEIHWLVGAANGLSALPPEKMNLLDPGLAHFVRLGKEIPLERYLSARNARVELGRRTRLFHETYDLLLLPTLAVPAFPVERRAPEGIEEDDWASWSPFSYPFNLTLQPAISVPCGFTGSGLPVGIQIVGDVHQDALVLRAARAYEALNPTGVRHPPLAAS